MTARAVTRELARALRTPGAVPDMADEAWPALVAFAESERLAPALAHALRASAWERVPAESRARLEQRAREALARHVLMWRDEAALLRAFRARAIDVLVLKGPVLAETLYPAPSLRWFSDLDLLVRPGDVARADDLLQALGWTRTERDHTWAFDVAYDGETEYRAIDRAPVDLHWRLLNAARYPWNRAGMDGAWARAVPVTIAGEPARTLAAEDLLVYLAAHLAVQHAGVGLRWHLDLALLVDRGVDWPSVLVRAREWHMARATAFALACAHATFGVVVPAAVLDELRGHGPRAAAASAVARFPDAPRRRLEHLMPMLLADRARDAVRSLRESFVPSRAWLAARYPATAGRAVAGYLAHYRRLGAIVSAAATRRR